MKISVIGGGYVGLVSSTCLAELGHDVEIIEIFEDKVRSINLGIPPIYEQGLQEMLTSHAGNRLRATTDYSNVANSHVILICVGTPPKNDGSADLSMIVAASKAIGEALKDSKDYHVVAVKSTVPPGTTKNVVMPTVLEYSGKFCEDIGFVMNPEFLREGLAVQDFMNPDRIVIGSYDERAGNLFAPIYRGLKAPVVRTSLTAAEMIKYASNAFLATKISFSNELGNVCKRIGIDVYEVMKGVGMDHRISPHFLNAGAGFGGSCFPKDVSALIHLAKDVGEDPILLKSVVEVNERQPMRIIELLEKRVGNLAGKKVAVLGLAFKNDTDDARESRSIPVIAELIKRGAKVKAYDPKANSSMSKIYPAIDYFQSASDALKDADACLVMTEWPEFRNLDKEFDLMRSRAIIDARKVLSCKDAEGICW
jgi:UDPglucose 6-dehydrogenase